MTTARRCRGGYLTKFFVVVLITKLIDLIKIITSLRLAISKTSDEMAT